MDVRVVNSFIDAARLVLKCYLPQEVKIGNLSVKNSCYPTQDINIVLGMVGQMRGQIIYGMENMVAQATVSQMMGGCKIEAMDEMAFSAISELANMISGNAAAALGDMGIHCNITPPLIITGQRIELHTLEVKSLVIPLYVEVGQIIINIALEEV